MILDWIKHLPKQEDKDNFQKEVEGARRVLDRLSDILREDEAVLNRSEISLKSYEIPNWDYRQAHKNGARAQLYRVLELINLDQRIQNDHKFTG